MVSRAFAGKQLRRLSGLEYFGTLNDEAIGELITALARADSEIIAVAAVNEWLEVSGMRPTPVDIRRILVRMSGHSAACARCCDTGLLSEGEVFEQCSCPAGDVRSAKDWVGQKIYRVWKTA